MGIEALLLSQVITINGSTGQVVTRQADGTLALEDAAGGGIGGSTGATDNAILRADGTGGATLQNSGVTISDNSEVLIVSGATSAVPLRVRGAASQTGNLADFQDSSGAITLFSIRAALATAGQEIFATSTAASPHFCFQNNRYSVGKSGGNVVLNGDQGAYLATKDAHPGNLRAGVDNNSTAGNTPLLLVDNSKGTLQRVSIGAADSGGTGFKVLRVPN